MSDTRIQELEKVASQVRRDILRMVHNVGSGHPGGAMGCTEYFVSLFFELMEHNTDFNMNGKDEDLFFLSNGHISAVYYSVLARSGYFPVAELSTHRKINSRLQGHPATHEKLPGIRMAAGSLGQGLSAAVGSALTKKLNKEDKLVYVLMGDGEQQEGQIWEAAMYAAHNKVDNLIATIDYNGQQIDGPLEEILSLLDLQAKYEAFGWDVIVTEKGNDMSTVLSDLKRAKASTGKGKPVMILLKSDMGSGVDFMSGTHKWHGAAPNDEQLESALGQLEETLGDF
jgi:transketolase